MQYKVRVGTVAEAIKVERQIPEFDRQRTELDYQAKLKGRKFLVLIAEAEGQLLGYKVGYEISATEFYSWLGGVVPEYRGFKVASTMRKHQENWASEQGFHSIRVNTFNKFRSMLQMLISSGYNICDFEQHKDLNQCKIAFIKKLRVLA